MAQGLWDVVPGQHLPTPTQGSPCPPWVGVTADILPPVSGLVGQKNPRKGFLPRPLVTLRLGGFLLPLWTHFFICKMDLFEEMLPKLCSNYNKGSSWHLSST